MINGTIKETTTRTYAVSGEGPVDRPYSTTKIVANLLTVRWSRTDGHGWRCEWLEVDGWRGKGPVGDIPSETPAKTNWWTDYRKDGTARWSSPVDPPIWAAIVAMNDCPQGGPLEHVREAVDAIDLDDQS